jgi:hypothetical protein
MTTPKLSTSAEIRHAARALKCAKSSQKSLLMYHALNINNSGGYFKPEVDLCYETGLSPKTTREGNAYLQELGVLTISTHPWGTSQVLVPDYALHLKPMLKLIAAQTPVRASRKDRIREQTAERVRRLREREESKARVTHQSTVTLPQYVTGKCNAVTAPCNACNGTL